MTQYNVRDPKTLDGLSVVVKIAERCNIACRYCYFFFAGDETYLKHPATIPAENVEGMCAFFKDAVERLGVRDLRIGFHGGEPLLLKKDRFVGMCEQIRAAVGNGCRLTFVVQTNAMLIDAEWVDIFERFDVRLGVSFDGPREIHDVARLDKKGRGTYQASEDGWFRLREAADTGRLSMPGILCVVSPEHSGPDIFNHFAGHLGSRAINFLLPDISHDSELANPAYVEQCGQFLVDVFDAWARRGDPGVRVRFITEVFGPLLNDDYCKRSALAKNSPFSQIVISSNGEICPDDTIRGLDARFRDTGLNVIRGGLLDVWSSDLWSELSEAHANPPTACRGCEWWNACKAGTVHHRFSVKNGFDNPSVFCSALKTLHRHIFDHLVRAGYDPEAMTARMAWRPEPPRPADAVAA